MTEVYPTPIGYVCMEWAKDGIKVSVEVSHDRMAFYYASERPEEVYDSSILEFDDGVCIFRQYLERL